MESIESIEQFYERLSPVEHKPFFGDELGPGHFNVFNRSSCGTAAPYSRRDYYKISLVLNTGKLHYADKWVYIDGPALLFSNPLIPYSWEPDSANQQGWFCLFTESFILPGEKTGNFQNSPLFRVGGNPIFFPDEQQLAEVSGIFLKMTKEINSSYPLKYDILRSCLHLLFHEAMKMDPTTRFEKHSNASARIAMLFMELLERQFPIDTPEAALKLKTANDFATHLSVHVNHLNRSVKEITRKTTTEHISARITKEAIALLQHTDWGIAEITYSLGFEYQSYFSNFLKKRSGMSPGKIRQLIV